MKEVEEMNAANASAMLGTLIVRAFGVTAGIGLSMLLAAAMFTG
jgi:hypothetical protein